MSKEHVSNVGLLNTKRHGCLILLLDINECRISNGGCEQICENFPGGFHCKCRTGFQLLHDKQTCQGEKN